jgi:hypothetical protein
MKGEDMRKVLIVAAVLFAAWVIGGSGCESSVTTAPVDQSVTEPDTSSQQETARIGDTLSITGSETTLEVTLLAVQNPATGYSEFMAPEKGNRFVAVKLSLRNVGDGVYDDAPSNCCKVVDVSSVGYSASMFDEITPGFGSTKITPGDKRVGWVTFQLPKSVKPAKLQYTPDSGFADATGEWVLAR